MGKKMKELNDDLEQFIKSQKLFFVGTAATEGRVNISPKGMDSLRVLGKKKIVWVNFTGSGNETAAHLLKDNRMTLMFCSFEKRPLILRLYGTASIFHPRDEEYQKKIVLFEMQDGARQIIEMVVDLVQTSCGFAVPFMEFTEERTTLQSWAEKMDQERIEDYWKEKNTKSIDGFETNIN